MKFESTVLNKLNCLQEGSGGFHIGHAAKQAFMLTHNLICENEPSRTDQKKVKQFICKTD